MDKQEYIETLHENDRLLVVVDDDLHIVATIAFFLTDNPKKFIRNDIWSIPKGALQENGKFFFVDKLITDHKIDLRGNLFTFFDYVKQKYPDKEIVWLSRGGHNGEIHIKVC